MIIKIPYVMALLIAAPSWIYKRRAHYRAHRHDFDMRHEVILNLLFVYGLAIAGMTLFPFVLLRIGPGFPHRFPPNFAPFVHIPVLFADPLSGIINVVGNIAVFVPLGILLQLRSSRLDRFWRVVLIGLACTVTIEVLQYVSGNRSADIDDVILNTLGTALGYVAYRVGRRIYSARRAGVRVRCR